MYYFILKKLLRETKILINALFNKYLNQSRTPSKEKKKREREREKKNMRNLLMYYFTKIIVMRNKDIY